MYNLMQLSYFLKNSPFLRVLIPAKITDRSSLNELLLSGIKETFIIIPNIGGLVIHLTNLKFNSTIRCLEDILTVANPESFLVFDLDNLYLESNGVQILDNNGILLFKKDVEKYLFDTEHQLINQVVHETLLDLALRVKFFDRDKTCNQKSITTSIDALLKGSCNKDQMTANGLVDNLASVNSTTRKRRLNRSSPFFGS